MVPLPPADAADWGGRLPRNETLELDDDQRAAADELRRGTARWAERSGFAPTDADGGLIGPFNAFVLRPGQGRRFGAWAAVDQRESSLSAGVREVVILTVGTAWDADYEIYAHVAVARSVGVSEAAISAIRSGSVEAGPDRTTAAGFTADELVAHRFADELVRTHRVSDANYAAALEAFGRDGALDLVHLVGMYLATSALLNAFEIPAPEIPALETPAPETLAP